MEVHRLDDALMAGDALAAIVARGAGRTDLARLLPVIARERRPVRIATGERHELAVLELRLDLSTEPREMTIGAVTRVAGVTAQARRHRRQLTGRREIDRANA